MGNEANNKEKDAKRRKSTEIVSVTSLLVWVFAFYFIFKADDPLSMEFAFFIFLCPVAIILGFVAAVMGVISIRKNKSMLISTFGLLSGAISVLISLTFLMKFLGDTI